MDRKQKPGKKPTPPIVVDLASGLTWFSNRTWVAYGILALSILLYVNTLAHDFALDDAIVITDNMYTQKGAAGIPGLLTHDTFYGFFKTEGKANLVSGGRYRPLTPVLFALERSIFGDGPFMHHLLNILFYALCCWLFYRMLLLIFRGNSLVTLWWACAAAFLFTAHPLHTEAVANIKGRDEILALLGSLIACICVLKAWDIQESMPQKSVVKFQLGGAVAMFLALMSKENAITFLAVVPLTLVFFRNASWGTAFRKILPLGGAALLFLLIRGSVIGWTMGSTPDELMNNPFLKWNGSTYIPFAAEEKWGTIFYTLGKYLQLLWIPTPLTHDYYPRHIGIMHLTQPTVLLSILLYVALGWLAWKGYKQKSIWGYAILVFLITLSIVSNIVFPIGTNMSERFLFMPSIGWALGGAWCISLLHKNKSPGIAGSWTLASIILFVITFAFSMLVIRRNPVWKDNFSLFTTDVKTSSQSAKLLNAAGGETLAQITKIQDTSLQRQYALQAEDYLTKALEIHPVYKNAWLLLGNSKFYQKQYDAAIEN